MRRVAVLSMFFALLPGCGQDLPGIDDPILTREDAITSAPSLHDIAVRQGVDLRRAPCIWDDATGASKWVIAVDAQGGRPFEEVARLCPSYAAGRVSHAVTLTIDGEIIEAR